MKKIVLCKFYEWDITLHEVIFSVFIIGVMLGIGYLISDSIKKSEHDRCLEYRQAAQITDNSEFGYAIETNIGNSYFEGHVKAVDPVKHKLLDNIPCMSIHMEYESYNMHTRTVTTTDSKGKTHTHIETYWTWDTYKTEKHNAKTVNVMGTELDASMFTFCNCREYKTVDTGWHKRISFSYIPAEFNGAGYAFLGPDMAKNNPHKIDIYKDSTIAKLYEHATTFYGNTVFWVFWIIAIIVVVNIFLYADNNWLENKTDDPSTSRYCSNTVSGYRRWHR